MARPSPASSRTGFGGGGARAWLARYDRWLVCLLGAAAIAVIYGVTYSFSVVIEAIAGTFQVTTARSSLLFSTNTVVSYGVAAVLGFVADRQPAARLAAVSVAFWTIGIVGTALADSYAVVFLTYGVVLAVGFGIGYVNVYATVARRFEDREGTALGIVSAGIGAGVLLGPPAANALLVGFDWQMVYVVLGGISVAVLVVLTVALAASDSDALLTSETASTDRFSARDILGSVRFWLVLAGFTLVFYTFYTLFIHLVPYANTVGVSATAASTALGIVGGVSIAGRLGSGYLSDDVGRLPLLVVGAVVLALAPLAVLASPSAGAMYVVAVAFGYGYGTVGSLFSPMVVDLFGSHSVGRMVGMTSISFAVAGSVGPYLTGLLQAATGTYTVPFAAASVTALVGAGFFVLSVRVGP